MIAKLLKGDTIKIVTIQVLLVGVVFNNLYSKFVKRFKKYMVHVEKWGLQGLPDTAGLDCRCRPLSKQRVRCDETGPLRRCWVTYEYV